MKGRAWKDNVFQRIANLTNYSQQYTINIDNIMIKTGKHSCPTTLSDSSRMRFSHFIITLLLLFTANVWQAKAVWFDKANHFTATQTTDGVVHFKILGAGRDKSGNDFSNTAYHLQNATMYCYVGTREYILLYIAEPNEGTHYRSWSFLASGDAEGHLHISNGQDAEDVVVDHSYYKDFHFAPQLDADGEATYMEFDWYIPEKFHNNTNITFKIVLHEYKWTIDDVGNWKSSSHQSDRTYFMLQDNPARGAGYKFSQPQLISSFLAQDDGNGQCQPGDINIIFSSQENVQSRKDDATYSRPFIKCEGYSGSYFMNSTDTLRKDYSTTMRVDYNKDPHEYHETQTTAIDIPAYHKIYDFGITLSKDEQGQYDGNRVLQWKIKYPKEKDIIENDFFEIQRATKPDFSDAESIQLIALDSNPDDKDIVDDEMTYTYVDDTELSKQWMSGGADHKLYYRIRRASLGSWDWNKCGVGTYTEDVTSGHAAMVANADAVYTAGFNVSGDESIKPHVTKYKDWNTSRKVLVQAQIDSKSISTGTFIYNPSAPITLKRTISQSPEAKSEVSIVIPADSIRLIDGKYCIKYTDVNDVPCVKYQYSIEIDTAGLSMSAIKDIQDAPVYKTTLYSADDMMYTNGIRLAGATASMGYHNDLTLVRWTTEGGSFEEYEVQRRLAHSKEEWVSLVHTYDTYYNDKEALGGKLYEYRIIGTLDCHEVLQDTITTKGFMSPYGSVSGKILAEDGIATPDVLVEATLVEDTQIDVHQGSLRLTGDAVAKTLTPLPKHDTYSISAMLRIPDGGLSANEYNIIKLGNTTISCKKEWLKDGKFNSFTLTFDGEKTNFYIDGEKVDSTLLNGVKYDAGHLQILSSGLYIDELRLFNYALSQDEVQKSYNRMLSGSEQGLLAYYRFDETAEIGGGFVYDSRILKNDDDAINLQIISSSSDVSSMYSDVAPSKEQLQHNAYTDNNGIFVISGLPYQGGATYNITPTSTLGTFMYNNDPSKTFATIGISAKNASQTDVNFVNTSTVRFNGRVLYEGSTIPVYHANFIVNGRPLYDASGRLVETDASGNFEFRVPKKQTIVQVVMKGHTFLNDGYFLNKGDKDLHLEDDALDRRMYDQTKVRLTGRIVGGEDEADKPLYKALSTNNLGDNLQFVMELEGDNISHIVASADENVRITERDDRFDHAVSGHYTTMHSTTKRIVVKPDILTGEYEILLPPTRYKIVQATADGYASLFPTGVTSQTLDLSRYCDKDTTVYSITYHSPISLTYEQLVNGLPRDFLGEQTMTGNDMLGKSFTADLVITDKDTKAFKDYLFDYPVFNSGKKYTLRVLAHEDYYYNNDPSKKHSQVVIKGEDMRVYNGLNTSLDPTIYVMDQTTGYAFVTLDVNNPTFSLSGKDALRQVDMSVKINGEYVLCDPLKAFVAGSRNKGKDQMVVLAEMPKLIDIIRDPQGANSYAFVENGSSYDFCTNSKLDVTVGLEIGATQGVNMSSSTGFVSAPMGAGIYNGFSWVSESATELTVPITTGINASWTKSYSFNLNKRISTSSDHMLIGAPADIYVGVNQGLAMSSVDMVTIIDTTTYRMHKPAIDAGNIRILADPKDGQPYYLAISEKKSIGETWTSDFAYTQQYILNSLLPRLIHERDSLLLDCSSDEAQKIANEQGKVVYRTLVESDDHRYGIDINVGYTMYFPENVKELNYTDMIDMYNKQIIEWCKFIAKNESIKVNCTRKEPDIVHSVVSGVEVSRTETTSHSHGDVYYWKGIGGNLSNLVSGGISKLLEALFGKGGIPMGNKTQDVHTSNKHNNKTLQFTVQIPSSKWQFAWDFIGDVDYSFDPSSVEGSSRTVGYVLGVEKDSYEDIAVYRISNDEYNKEADSDRKDADSGNDDMDSKDHLSYDYVFIRKAGATRNPYEDAEKTLFFQPVGTVYSAATLRIDNPVITLDKHEVSNVPSDEPATFVITMTNDSEVNDGRTFKPQSFSLYQDDDSNAQGLRIMMDGAPITDGRKFYIDPRQSIQKTIQVYRGTGYDYEDISLSLMSDDDITTVGSAKFTVHYMPVSTPVNLQLPVDNWVMNTLSPKDKDGYYLPVTIDGFDVNYDNFDHIELQYKLPTQGDDKWVNLCSYYSDSLYYNKASGNKDWIKAGKITNVKFYGERDPMEQKYDLRAVSMCRYGNSYITRASQIRTGTKDTRCPQIFGSVQPLNGIMHSGDNIIIPFSEDIAANYLDEDNNFQIIGFTNSFNITQRTSLSFSGAEGSKAESELTRNLNEKDFTLDLMIKPETNKRKMTYIAQGGDECNVSFGQNGKGNLFFTISSHGQETTTTSKAIDNPTGWSRVAVSYNHSTGEVTFWQGNKDISNKDDSKGKFVQKDYNGVGNIILGNDFNCTTAYSGSMLEVRLWNKALSQTEISKTNETTLSGHEKHLLVYYPLSGGKSNIAEDKAYGADLKLEGQAWNKPEGMSMHVDDKHHLTLNGKKFSASQEDDYTLTFWYRADEVKADTMAIMSSGRGVADELNAEGRIFFGLAPEGNIIVQHNGHMVIAEGKYADQQWHNVAWSVDRTHDVANLYVDGKKAAQMQASMFGSLTADSLHLGICKWSIVDSTGVYVQDRTYPFNGDIDDITFWNTVLSETYISEYYDVTPNDEEMALSCHLSFNRRKVNSTGGYETVYSPYNGKVRKDQNGNAMPLSEEDRLVLTKDAVAEGMATNQSAPVNDRGNIEKISFSWIGKDNELAINLNMLDKTINKQNIFITVRDVEDKAGNPLASPITCTLFIDRNQIRWSKKYEEQQIPHGAPSNFSVDINNEGATTLNYVIENIPEWLQVSSQQGRINPTETLPIHFGISDKLDPGEHSAIIYLTDQNGLSEPLQITANVIANEPEWEVDDFGCTDQMVVMSQVEIVEYKGAEVAARYVDGDERDIVAAFIGNNCVGKAHIQRTEGKSLLNMVIHGTKETRGKEITFQLWRASSGHTYMLSADEAISFGANSVKGSPEHPVVLKTTMGEIQRINLNRGWNWISLYVDPIYTDDNFYSAFMHDYTFTKDDAIKSLGFNAFYNGDWIVREGADARLNYHQSYIVKVHKGGTLSVMGRQLTTDSELTVHVNGGGWSYLPYLNTETMEVNRALGGYREYASPGDVIKGYEEFAVLSEDNRWTGSLTHLCPGVGYMIYRQNADDVDFKYSRNFNSNEANDDDAIADDKAPEESCLTKSHNMPIIAEAIDADGAKAYEGDILSAYTGGTLVGRAKADKDGRFYLMTSAEENSPLSFTLTRGTATAIDGVEISTADLIQYDSQSVVGSLDEPFVIDFSGAESMMAVYPRLFTDRVTFTAKAGKGDNVSFELYNIGGNRVFGTNLVGSTDTTSYTFTDADQLPSGVYVARITIGANVKTIKLIHK